MIVHFFYFRYLEARERRVYGIYSTWQAANEHQIRMSASHKFECSEVISTQVIDQPITE